MKNYGTQYPPRINELIENPEDVPLTILLTPVMRDHGTCGPPPTGG